MSDISLIETLHNRFLNKTHRHPNIIWSDVEHSLKLSNNLEIISKMEISGGEPDIIEFPNSSELYYVDCSEQSPNGRRSFCYDKAALDSRKANKPIHSAIDYANEIGCTMLDEEQYKFLQSLGEFDTKTSSWLLTPKPIRDLGGAIFGDRRFDRVFTYCNGAESYYAARGFRGIVKL